MSSLSKVIRGVVGIAVVVALIVVINSWYGQYKSANARSQKASKVSSQSSESTGVIPVQGQKVVVIAATVPLNSQAATGTKTVRVMKKGEELILVGVTANNWFQIRDSTGKFGYVANDPTNVKVQK